MPLILGFSLIKRNIQHGEAATRCLSQQLCSVMSVLFASTFNEMIAYLGGPQSWEFRNVQQVYMAYVDSPLGLLLDCYPHCPQSSNRCHKPHPQDAMYLSSPSVVRKSCQEIFYHFTFIPRYLFRDYLTSLDPLLRVLESPPYLYLRPLLSYNVPFQIALCHFHPHSEP